MDFIDFELGRQSAERRRIEREERRRKEKEIRRRIREEREERIKNGQICGTCEHWKLRIDKRVANLDLPCAQNWGIIDPNDTCHCWKANEENKRMENKNVLLCFKSDKDLQDWEKNNMSDFFKNSIRLGGHRYQIDDKIYKAAVMDSNLSHGYLPTDVYFINCFLDDCKDEKFTECLGFWESLGTVVHYW